MCLDCDAIGGGAESLVESATVKNTGSVAAAKVVMAFMSEVTPRAVLHHGIDDGTVEHSRAPNKNLFGMQKVFLRPGESKTLTFGAPLLPDFDDWCVFCTVTTKGTRVVAPGVYRLTIGGDGGSEKESHGKGSGSSSDSAIEIELTSQSSNPIAAPLHAMTLDF